MNKENLEVFKNMFEGILKDANQGFESAHWKIEGDDAERTSLEGEKSLDLKLKGRKALYFRKVEKALNRVKDGSYGECMECGDDISVERLQARPTATMCIHCKEEQENVENHILYSKKSHTHGKVLVIKSA